LQEMLCQGGTETKKRKISPGTSGTSRDSGRYGILPCLCRSQTGTRHSGRFGQYRNGIYALVLHPSACLQGSGRKIYQAYLAGSSCVQNCMVLPIIQKRGSCYISDSLEIFRHNNLAQATVKKKGQVTRDTL